MICNQHKEKKVTISYSNHITENYKAIKVPFVKVMDLVKSEYNYSMGTFKNGYRNKENYLGYCDLLILDVDDGLTIKEAKKIFEPFDYIIATTKSHQKDKNGLVCDRYRIILPLETPMNLSEEDYNKTMAEVHKKYPFVDKACKDGARFYYPSKDSEVIIHGGFINFMWEEFYEKTKKPDHIQERLNHFKKNFVGFQKTKEDVKYEYGLQKVDYIRQIAKTEKLLELLKFKDKFISGQRNTTMYSYAKYFQDIGLNNDEIRDLTLWVNSCGDSISESEIEKTIFRSIKV